MFSVIYLFITIKLLIRVNGRLELIHKILEKLDLLIFTKIINLIKLRLINGQISKETN